MAEPGIALVRGRLPGPEAQPDLDRDPLVVDQAEAVLRQIVPVSPASVREYPRASVQTIGLAVAMKLTTNAPDALAEAHRPWAAVIGVKRMIRTMIEDRKSTRLNASH